jgi:hypothetical protein
MVDGTTRAAAFNRDLLPIVDLPESPEDGSVTRLEVELPAPRFDFFWLMRTRGIGKQQDNQTMSKMACHGQ